MAYRRAANGCLVQLFFAVSLRYEHGIPEYSRTKQGTPLNPFTGLAFCRQNAWVVNPLLELAG